MPAVGPHVLGGGVNLLRRRMPTREVDNRAAKRRIARESPVAAVEDGFAGSSPLGFGVPDEEPIDVRVGLEAGSVLLRDEIEAAGAQLGMIHRGQRVEHGTVEDLVQFGGDVTRRLLAELAEDDAVLRFERGDCAVLKKEHQPRGADRGQNGDDERMRTPREESRFHGPLELRTLRGTTGGCQGDTAARGA